VHGLADYGAGRNTHGARVSVGRRVQCVNGGFLNEGFSIGVLKYAQIRL
jgi:hypothetical protein